MYVQLEGSFVFKTKANVQLDLYKGQGENITFADISETLNIRVMKPGQSRIKLEKNMQVKVTLTEYTGSKSHLKQTATHLLVPPRILLLET